MSLSRDLHFAIRSLRHNPGFTLAAVATLAAGIGAGTAIFSIVDGVVLRPLPYQGAERIVGLWQHDRGAGIERDDVAIGNFIEWRERSGRIDRMAVIEPFSLDWRGPEGPEELRTWLVTDEFFGILDIPTHLGRSFSPEDFVPGSGGVVLSYATWRDRFGADSALVGRTINLDDQPVPVLGVLARAAQYPADGEIWVPRVVRPDERDDRDANYLEVIGRLAEGTTLEAARNEMNTIGRQLAEEFPDSNAEVGVTVLPLEDQILGRVGSAMLVMLGAVVVLLLLACVNVANLVLARGAGRVRELATRVAMGAGRGRLVRQLWIEHLVLALIGGGLGVLLAVWGVGSLKGLAPAGFPRMETVTISSRVIGLAALVSVGTSILFGLVPVAQAARQNLHTRLGGSGRSLVGGRDSLRIRDALVAVQLALALVLLVGAGLLGRSFLRLISEDPGYQTENVVGFTTQAWRFYRSEDERAEFVRQAIERLESAPGVISAGMTSSLPLTPAIYADRATFTVEGQPAAQPGRAPSARGAAATAGYFDALGIPLIAGRTFTPSDDGDAPTVALISHSLAREHFGDSNPVGATLSLNFAGPPTPTQVIGVVGDIRHQGLDDPPEPFVYVPHAQHPTGAITFTVRTTNSAEAAARALRQRVWDMNPNVTLTDAGTLDGLLAETLKARRFYLTLLGLFSVAAVFLAVVGLYGLISYAVRRRVGEVGIRLALGARGATILRLFLSRAAGLVLAGLAVGVVAAIGLTRYLSGLLYEIDPFDPLTIVGMSLLLALIALLATWIPAARATRVDPARTLRVE